jgi:probable phosphoglycerate mutase
MAGDPVAATSVLLVRHGQSTWNAEGRWQGQADAPLSPLGEAQARAGGHRLQQAAWAVDLVACSDLQRARRTAELLAEAIGAGPVHVVPELRETNAGEWTGLTRADIDTRFPGWLSEHRRPPGFEPWEHVAERAWKAMAVLHALAPTGRVVAVAHGGVIRALERSLDVLGAVVPNLSGRWFTVGPGHPPGAGGNGTLHVVAGDRVLLVDPTEAAVTTPHQL